MEFVVAENFRADDPTVGIKLPKVRAGGFHTWTEAEIAEFEERHPIGTRARLALALLLYTAQARVDVVGIGPQHIRGMEIVLRRQKTGKSRQIPVHPLLGGPRFNARKTFDLLSD
jgi:site-specific recombinase XerD